MSHVAWSCVWVAIGRSDIRRHSMSRNCHLDSNVDNWIPFVLCSNSKFARSKKKAVVDFHLSSEQRFEFPRYTWDALSPVRIMLHPGVMWRSRTSAPTVRSLRSESMIRDLALSSSWKLKRQILISWWKGTVLYRIWGYPKSSLAFSLARLISACKVFALVFNTSNSSSKDFFFSSNCFFSFL